MIINGGFETPVVSTAWATYYAGSAALAPWEILSGSIDVVTIWEQYEGNNSLDLAGDSEGTIQQSFTTVPGKQYTLSFHYANNSGRTTPASATVNVIGSSSLYSDMFFHAASTGENMLWTPYTSTFVADSATTTLRFTDHTFSAYGIVLDAISVTAARPVLHEVRKLTASDTAMGDWFGNSVALSGNIALVGAPYKDDAGTWSGSAYLFDAATGTEIFKLTASDSALGDQFGSSVAVSGNLALVGAPGDNNLGTDSGSAYVFDVTTGQELFKLTASDAAEFDSFGRSVAISGNIAVVGAPWNNGAGYDSGTAYVFDVTTGEELFKLTASDAFFDNWFGWAVAFSGNLALVGAPYKDDAGFWSGSAYIFELPLPGDFDGDGDVDGRDFLAWQRGESTRGPLDAQDLADWQVNYNLGSLTTITAVPEPTSAVSLAIALALGLCRRRVVVQSRKHASPCRYLKS